MARAAGIGKVRLVATNPAPTSLAAAWPGGSIRVVKIGGSLLDCADLPRRWRHWQAGQPPALNVLVPGGGAFADAIRQADKTHALGDQTAHVLAIGCLSLTARLLAYLLPESQLAGRLPEIRTIFDDPQRDPATPVILDLGACWQDPDSQPALGALPASWDVTSDSLAAAAARAIGAAELVLLKSAAPPATELPALAAAGFIDQHFPQAAAGLAVRLVNLRSAD